MKTSRLAAGAVVALSVAVSSVPHPSAQAPDPKVPATYEAASVKPNIARPDGTLGPKLKPTTTDCEKLMAANRGGPPPTPPGPNAPSLCGMRGTFGQLLVNAMPMSLFANNLPQRMQRVVVDRTGSTGNWDFELSFAPEPPAGPLPPGVELPPADPNAPSLVTAIQEQLGLRLQSTKGPVEVLVVDRIEQLIPD
jgi:uncharacterized protein (TIGR03435 family)